MIFIITIHKIKSVWICDYIKKFNLIQYRVGGDLITPISAKWTVTKHGGLRIVTLS